MLFDSLRIKISLEIFQKVLWEPHFIHYKVLKAVFRLSS